MLPPHRYRGTGWGLLCALILMAALAPHAGAHVSERALVLLLPTDVYIRSGAIAVAVTVLLLAFVPHALFTRWTRAVRLLRLPVLDPLGLLSLAAMTVFFIAVYLGVVGSRDPLANPLPLLIWTVWWIAVPIAQGLFGDIWRSLNPWTGLHRLIGSPEFATLPSKLGYWPAILSFIAFTLFQVAYIAPDDPDRLAAIAGGYWVFTFGAMILFGKEWLERGEPFSVYFTQLAKISAVWRRGEDITAALPGARLLTAPAAPSLAFLILIALAAGSFDGLNETFWWLAQIGINPLAFPGRSAVALPNSIGVLGGMLALTCVFSAFVWFGLWLARGQSQFRALFPRFALSLLPIALGYHLAHYLTSFLVDGQYVIQSLSDPFGTGADYLNLGHHYVTTSFFNVPTAVKLIWLTQAGAIVGGHILAVLIAHGIALEALGTQRRAVLSQIPVGSFMVIYTFFGLWILAQPTGA